MCNDAAKLQWVQFMCRTSYPPCTKHLPYSLCDSPFFLFCNHQLNNGILQSITLWTLSLLFLCFQAWREAQFLHGCWGLADLRTDGVVDQFQQSAFPLLLFGFDSQLDNQGCNDHHHCKHCISYSVVFLLHFRV